MVSLADSLVASSSRPLGLRVRPDLSARRQRYQGRSYWVVKEPVGLRYFRFQEEEYAVLQMLDGPTSLEDVKQRFETEFAPHKITYQDLQGHEGRCHDYSGAQDFAGRGTIDALDHAPGTDTHDEERAGNHGRQQHVSEAIRK